MRTILSETPILPELIRLVFNDRNNFYLKFTSISDGFSEGTQYDDYTNNKSILGYIYYYNFKKCYDTGNLLK